MAFKNTRLALTTVKTDIYTVPEGKTAIILMAQIANIDITDESATVVWSDVSNSNTETNLIKDVTIPVGAALSIIEGKLVLESGDSLKGTASTDSKLEITISVMEMDI